MKRWNKKGNRGIQLLNNEENKRATERQRLTITDRGFGGVGGQIKKFFDPGQCFRSANFCIRCCSDITGQILILLYNILYS
jgi:hypothetical protein